jgi:hypothetical protein
MDVASRAGGQQIAAMAEDFAGDAGDLRRGFSPAVDHLGEAAAEGAVMVDLGEPQFPEGQPAQFAEQRVFRELAGAESGQEGSEFALVHEFAIV